MIVPTSGPWRAERAYYVGAEDDEHVILANIDGEDCRLANVYSPADARLIAQAPAMLDAIKSALYSHGGSWGCGCKGCDDLSAILRAVEE